MGRRALWWSAACAAPSVSTQQNVLHGQAGAVASAQAVSEQSVDRRVDRSAYVSGPAPTERPRDGCAHRFVVDHLCVLDEAQDRLLQLGPGELRRGAALLRVIRVGHVNPRKSLPGYDEEALFDLGQIAAAHHQFDAPVGSVALAQGRAGR